ncbi:MAG: SMC-Scp complex subunit ScpB [Pseudomonadales bacterium]|nr:SMC-Scp complex subunit ScpB [Pseudomonadales bacterium]
MASDVDNKVKMIVEGLLLAAGRPLTLDNIAQVFSKRERPDKKELKTVLQAIAEECDGRGFELKEVASGYRFQVKQELSEWVAKLWEEKPPRYTRALLETLSLIAYRQPITRGDIEEIRGVSVSPNIIRTLIDRDWIRVVGHRDVPGRPAMFAITKLFLDYFNLKSLQGLPPLSEVKELEPPEPEFDLNEELLQSRILELPDENADEESRALTAAEEAELIAEEEAVELAKKPLDEILRMGVPEELLEKEESDEAEEAEDEVAEEEPDEEIDDDEDDLDIGLTDDDIAANEEFERNLRKNSDSEDSEEETNEEIEDVEHESNVIPLHGNKNQVQDEDITEFEFTEVEDANSVEDEQEEIEDGSAAIEFVIEDSLPDEGFSEDTNEINYIGDDHDENR